MKINSNVTCSLAMIMTMILIIIASYPETSTEVPGVEGNSL